jgi:hypothetical protein
VLSVHCAATHVGVSHRRRHSSRDRNVRMDRVGHAAGAAIRFLCMPPRRLAIRDGQAVSAALRVFSALCAREESVHGRRAAFRKLALTIRHRPFVAAGVAAPGHRHGSRQDGVLRLDGPDRAASGTRLRQSKPDGF